MSPPVVPPAPRGISLGDPLKDTLGNPSEGSPYDIDTIYNYIDNGILWGGTRRQAIPRRIPQGPPRLSILGSLCGTPTWDHPEIPTGSLVPWVYPPCEVPRGIPQIP